MTEAVRKAFVCPGQGTRLEGLGRELFARHPELTRRAEQFSRVVGHDVHGLLCHSVDGRDTLAAHLALVSYALLFHEATTKVGDVAPFIMLAGHSLGEISALACAGALTLDDALRLAYTRGQAMGKACAARPGGMLALLDSPWETMRTQVLAYIAEYGVRDLWIANINGPSQIVLSGDREGLAACAEHMRAFGANAVPLPTAGAFHSPYMTEAAEEVLAFAHTLDWHKPHTPCLSSMTGTVLVGNHFAAHCALQMVSPVCWLDVMLTMRRARIAELVEAGRDGTLTRLFATTKA